MFGNSGTGKDAAFWHAWPDGYFLGHENTEASWSFWGPEMAPDEQQMLLPILKAKGVRPSMLMISFVLDAIARGQFPWRPAIMISDLSICADADADQLEHEYGSNWDKWKYVGQRTRILRDKARALNMVVAVNGHKVGPKEAPGHPDFIPGGIKMPSHKSRAELHKMTDVNIETVSAPDLPTGPLFRFGMRVEDDEETHLKDRGNKIEGILPLNLREALIASPNPIWVPRRLGMEWCDSAADKVVSLIQAGAPPLEAAEQVESTAIAAGKHPKSAYMAAWDGICRHVIRSPGLSRFARARQALTASSVFDTTSSNPESSDSTTKSAPDGDKEKS